MHRDVKPSNIIVNLETLDIKLIDWGLSEYYIPDKDYHTRVSSRPYKSPELLSGFQKYDFSMDIWSVGCMLAAFVFQTEYFFLGSDNRYQLVEIVNFLGTDEFYNYLNKYQIKLELELYSLLKK